jgi:hypothetical protein
LASGDSQQANAIAEVQHPNLERRFIDPLLHSLSWEPIAIRPAWAAGAKSPLIDPAPHNKRLIPGCPVRRVGRRKQATPAENPAEQGAAASPPRPTLLAGNKVKSA